MSEKIKKAEILLDCIGDIDDALLAESLAYRPKRRAPRLALIAACMALSIVLVFGVIGALNIITSDRDYDAGINNAPDKAPSISAPSSLDELFVTSEALKRCDKEL